MMAGDDERGVEIVALEMGNDLNDEDEVDSEEEEFLGLFPSGNSTVLERSNQNNVRKYNKASKAKGFSGWFWSATNEWGKCLRIIVVLSGSLLIWIILMGLLSLTKDDNGMERGSTSHRSSLNNTGALDKMNDNGTSLLVPYQCPKSIAKAANDKAGIFQIYNEDNVRHFNAFNESVENLLDMEYGAWGITPNQRKELNSHWVHWYADALLGDSDPSQISGNRRVHKTIYESACGVGLTLYVILELLQERYNITGLEVYGNEYMMEDVITANRFYGRQELSNKLPLHLKKGRICHGDSTNMTFVPSNAFDVVMTGYIDPIVDPLKLHLSRKEHKKYCASHNKEQVEAIRQEQELVEDWFAAWAGEMIRIAKPGGTIVLESISQERCLVGDWGGVAKTFWANVAVEKYGWSNDIDPAAITVMDFDVTKKNKNLHDRYNVKMVKKKA